MQDISDLEIARPPIQSARRSVAIVLVVITTIAIALLFFVSLTYFRSLDREDAETRVLLYQRSLGDTLERYGHLPYILARDVGIIAAFNGPPDDALNSKLAEFADQADLEAIYLMDRTGRVIAASNHDQPHSFVGQNYGFRPYFQEALAGVASDYFGVGATTGRPGYFLSEPVRDSAGRVLGVVAIKLDVSELQQAWENGGEIVLASNADDVVVLASDRDWLYRTLTTLPSERLSEIRRSKQFGAQPLTPLPWEAAAPGSIRLADRTYIYVARTDERLGWKIHYLLGEGRARERTFLTTLLFGGAISLLVGFATYLRSQRIQVALMSSQLDRRQLRLANRDLEAAHSELARSSKLAALGQLSASVVHELGQPISALRNYLTAEEIAGDGASRSLHPKIGAVVDRMENITRQLRFFTKPGETRIEAVDLRDVVSGCLELMEHDILEAGVALRSEADVSDLVVRGNRLRLEQVLVNLVKNSLQALKDAAATDLEIRLSRVEDRAVLSVSDNGTGFGPRALADLQEPFHTTRASGDGMGLGLAIASEIIKEHNGVLTAENRPGGGAVFSVSLPVIDATGRGS